jgi:hypothetical protein
MPLDTEWTGAEVRACCRLAALLDVPLVDAAQHIVPVAVTAAESVERLRGWGVDVVEPAESEGYLTLAPDEAILARVERALV